MPQELKPPFAIEIVRYRLSEGADAQAFLKVCRAVEVEFTSNQPGFLAREIGHDDDGNWAIFVYWQSAQHAHDSIANIETIPQVVKDYMTMVDRETLNRGVFTIT